MAITSAAGATLTKNHTSGSGTAVPVSFTTQGYGAWIKVPSIGTERTLFDHDGRVIIKINTAGKIVLYLDGVLVGTGTTTFDANKWIFWAYKRNPTTTHNVQICKLDCVDSLPVLQTPTTEINITHTMGTGSPSKFTFHVPAGCATCMFTYGGSGLTNPIGLRLGWNTTVNSTGIWRCPLRFPDDLNDHREISVTSGPTTFAGMHQWDSQTGTITLALGSDPEHLLNKICSAVLGVRVAEINLIPGSLIPGQIIEIEQAIPLTILTNVMPSTAILSRISVDGKNNIQATGSDLTFPSYLSRWTFQGSATQFDYGASHGSSGSFIFCYVWNTLWGGPNPNVNHPVTGLPWTVNDLYNATFKIVGHWHNTDATETNIGIDILSKEVGLSTLYFGQSTAGVCGETPPVVQVGTIIVVKDANITDGTVFPFNAVGLTPNAFTLLDNGSIQYDNVPYGSGYSIVETVPSGWTVSYNVSNGSPNTNINVGVGEIVVVTVTNTKLPNATSGIYKIVPNKRQDTLWLEGFTGTRDVKIP